MIYRCDWCGHDPLYQRYHDKEWGVPVHNERKLFEMLCLEGAQAGLSWLTILKKRGGYKKAFNDFDIISIVQMNEAEIIGLRENDAIIRNRLKINAVVENAKCVARLYEQGSSLCDYLWKYVDGRPVQNSFQRVEDIPASTPLSEQMSKDLKKLGFKFVGPTICYALMQSIGMVNDHIVNCFRYEEVKRLGGNSEYRLRLE